MTEGAVPRAKRSTSSFGENAQDLEVIEVMCVLFFLAALITVRAKLTVIMVRRSVFFPVRYHTIGSSWPL